MNNITSEKKYICFRHKIYSAVHIITDFLYKLYFFNVDHTRFTNNHKVISTCEERKRCRCIKSTMACQYTKVVYAYNKYSL